MGILLRESRESREKRDKRRPSLTAGTVAVVAAATLAMAQPGLGQDTTAPNPTGASVDPMLTEEGKWITVTFSEPLARVESREIWDTVVVKVDGADVAETATVRADGKLWVVSSPWIAVGQSVVVTYTDPTSGNDVASFTTGVGGVPAVVNNSHHGATVPGPVTEGSAMAVGKHRVDLSWEPPADDGGLPITGYQVWSVSTAPAVLLATTGSTVTTYSVTGLPSGIPQAYEIAAVNAIGPRITAGQELLLSATTAPNSVPAFTSSSVTFSVAEGTASGAALGSPVTATDADDGDTLTYSLVGTGAAFFEVDETSGQLRTSAALDHESVASHSVTVRVVDDDAPFHFPFRQFLGEAEATVTIDVTDVDEPPGRPAAPAVSAVHVDNPNLDVAWSAPDNAGRPAIMNYDVRYRKEDAPGWTDGPQDVTETTKQIESLDAGAVYLVQVRASNDEGDGPYSEPGTSSTHSADNFAPTFDLGGVTRGLEESLGDEVDVGGVAIGNPVTATDKEHG